MPRTTRTDVSVTSALFSVSDRGAVAHILGGVWTLDSREVSRVAARFNSKSAGLFWETETQIGSDIPLPVITDGNKQGSADPIAGRVDYVGESRGGK